MDRERGGTWPISPGRREVGVSHVSLPAWWGQGLGSGCPVEQELVTFDKERAGGRVGGTKEGSK